jgi:uncharacterized protein with PQ loop repeat
MHNVFGLIVAFVFTCAYVPQIIKIIKTKTSAGVSPMMYWFCVVGYISGILYITLAGATGLVVWVLAGYILSLIFCLWSLILIYRYD